MRIEVQFSELASDEQEARQWRAIVRQISMLDRSHYYQMVREGRDWFQGRTDHSIEEDLSDMDFIQLRNIVYFRAEILAALPRQMSPDGTRYLAQTRVGDGQWEDVPLPSEWMTLNGMAEIMPVGFLDALIEATRSLNAGVMASIPDFLAQSRVTTRFIT